MKNSIETKQLSKTYGNRRVVDDLNLHVPEGCVYGVLGPNGAGKSTTMKMLLGLIHPTGGSVRLLGQTLTETNRIALLRQTGSLIESPAGYLHLTAEENLKIVADLKEVDHKDIDRVLEIVRLTQDGKRKVGQYSLGMKQRLGIAMALLGEMEQMVTQVGILDHGRLLFEGALTELQKHSLGGYALRLLDPEKGLPVLREQGFSAQPDEKGRIPLPALPDAELAHLSGLLAASGAGVVGLTPKSRSLEEIFLSLTQHPQPENAKDGEQRC